jgi:hypothetical protein
MEKHNQYLAAAKKTAARLKSDGRKFFSFFFVHLTGIGSFFVRPPRTYIFISPAIAA